MGSANASLTSWDKCVFVEYMLPESLLEVLERMHLKVILFPTLYVLHSSNDTSISTVVSNCHVYVLTKVGWNVLAAWIIDFIGLAFLLHFRAEP